MFRRLPRTNAARVRLSLGVKSSIMFSTKRDNISRISIWWRADYRAGVAHAPRSAARALRTSLAASLRARTGTATCYPHCTAARSPLYTCCTSTFSLLPALGLRVCWFCPLTNISVFNTPHFAGDVERIRGYIDICRFDRLLTQHSAFAAWCDWTCGGRRTTLCCRANCYRIPTHL